MILKILLLFLIILKPLWALSAINDPEESVELYPCNYAVSYQNPNPKICKDSQGQLCSENSPHCTCYSPSFGGISANVLFSNRTGASNSSLVQAHQNQSSKLFALNDSWNYFINKISTQITSEHYGSSQEISYCYLGPEKTTGSGGDLSEGIYAIEIVVGTNQANQTSIEYFQDALLEAQFAISCDLRGLGAKQTSRSRKNGETVPLNGMEQDLLLNGASSFYSNSVLFMSDLNQFSNQIPRFCIIKVSLKETALSKVRKNKNSPIDFNFNISVYKK